MTRRCVALASLLLCLCGSALAAAEAAPRAEISTQPDPFAIPSGLEPAVEFWKAIFLDYGSGQLVFFDPWNMSRIHEVVDVKEGVRTRNLVRSVHARLQRRGIPSRRIKAQRGIRERFEAGVRRSGRYREHMRKVFAARGLPVELTWLPLVESSFRNDARSFRGAVGMWQFMPRTGRRYMRVTRLVDERRDPLEATRAAARLLQENYRELGTWPLAVTAYNHGRAGMKRAVRKVGTRDLPTIIRGYRSRTFKFASRNFYAEFLAAVHIMRDVERRLPHVRFDPPEHLDEIPLGQRVPVSSLLRRSRVSRAELLEWNPALSRRIAWIPEGYRLKAPALQSRKFREALAGIGPASSFPHHVVRRGDTLSGIAREYGTSTTAIQAINDLGNIHRLRVGQRLELPDQDSARRAPGRSETRRRVYHRVRPGETLSTIADRYQVSLAALQRANAIRNRHRIRAGQRLRIPGTQS